MSSAVGTNAKMRNCQPCPYAQYLKGPMYDMYKYDLENWMEAREQRGGSVFQNFRQHPNSADELQPWLYKVMEFEHCSGFELLPRNLLMGFIERNAPWRGSIHHMVQFVVAANSSGSFYPYPMHNALPPIDVAAPSPEVPSANPLTTIGPVIGFQGPYPKAVMVPPNKGALLSTLQWTPEGRNSVQKARGESRGVITMARRRSPSPNFQHGNTVSDSDSKSLDTIAVEGNTDECKSRMYKYSGFTDATKVWNSYVARRFPKGFD